MAPGDEVTRTALAVSEGFNCLGLLVCGPAFRKFRTEASQALQRWETDFAPAIREVAPGLQRVDQARLGAALERISSMAKAGVDIEDPEQLAALRLAIREALRAFGVPLPDLAPEEAAICKLHGSACPILEGPAE